MKIVVGIPFTEKQKEKLRKVSEGEQIQFVAKNEWNEEAIKDADVIMGNLPEKMLQAAKNLKWLQLNSAGANQYCSKEVLPEKVILTNAAGAYGTSVSEHMLAQTVSMVKRLGQYQNNQRECKWNDEGKVLAFHELTIVILGMGDIGTAYAKKMKALGSYVIGVRKSSTEHDENYDEAVLITDLEKVLSKADVTAIILPGTDDTRGMFDEKLLRKMKPGSYLLNAGRGNIVDTQALIKIMEEEYLAGVALDVTDPEPLPENHPLWNAKNVWITPHIAGKFQINETLENICSICCENMKRLKENEPLLHVVDRKNQY